MRGMVLQGMVRYGMARHGEARILTMTNLEVTAKFTGERFRFTNTGGDVIIGNAFNDENFTFTIKGPAGEGELVKGLSYRFFGRWSNYKPRTGPVEKQFHFKSFVREEPASREAIVSYIAEHGKGLGIGPAKAGKLFEVFGTESIKICKEDPARVVETLKGVKIEQATSLAAALQEDEAIERIKLDLQTLLENRGFPKKTAKAAIEQWGNRASEIIRRNPYKLMIFEGCGFKRCDSLYLDLGLNPTRLLRQALAGWYGIARDTEGHTWYGKEWAEAYIRGNIGGTKINPERAITLAVRAKLLAEQDGMLAEYQKAKNERSIAEVIVSSVREASIWPDVNDVKGITEHQREGLANATREAIGILSGSPGTGKTWTVASLVEAMSKTVGLKNICIGAPTGKAAVRVTENLANRGIPIRARTWHSLLFSKIDQYKVWIGDETSMNDTDLMAGIFRARPGGTNLLLLGDVNQLSPVGHGAPMRDLIKAEIPTGELTEIKRNSGGIVEACAAIRDCRKWEPGSNLLLHECGSDKQIDRMLQRIQNAKAEGLDPVWDCQILVAVNERSPLARKELNRFLQTELNTNPGSSSIPFKVRDKIVNTKNAWFRLHDEAKDPDIQTNEHNQCFVANGELAEVLDIQGSGFIAKVRSPERIIFVPISKDSESEESTVSTWDLGYAISVHKSQGSDWPVAIVMIDEYPGARLVCDRSWIYTAISRAKDRCELIGKKEVADRFCAKSNIWKRRTFLVETINQLRAAELLAMV